MFTDNVVRVFFPSSASRRSLACYQVAVSVCHHCCGSRASVNMAPAKMWRGLARSALAFRFDGRPWLWPLGRWPRHFGLA